LRKQGLFYCPKIETGGKNRMEDTSAAVLMDCSEQSGLEAQAARQGDGSSVLPRQDRRTVPLSWTTAFMGDFPHWQHHC